MNKGLLALLVFLGIQTQAQINYCDSMQMNILSSSQFQIQMETNLTTIVPGVIDYYWETTDFGSGYVIGTDTTSIHNFVQSPNMIIPDTIMTCLTVLIDINGFIYTCIECDTLFWDGNLWSLISGSSVLSSWDCSLNSPLGCYDPGTGNGQYSTLTACQSACGSVTPSWDCAPAGCYDPGTGNGQYSTLVACDSVCGVVAQISPCDSIEISIVSTWQNYVILDVILSNINAFTYNSLQWDLYDILGNVISTDTSQSPTFSLLNPMNADTLPVCLTAMISMPNGNTFACFVCDTLVYINGNWTLNSLWVPLNIETVDRNNNDRKLLRIVDNLGRDTESKNGLLLFYIYDDGTIEKKIILE